jgi:hypothetical protein
MGVISGINGVRPSSAHRSRGDKAKEKKKRLLAAALLLLKVFQGERKRARSGTGCLSQGVA